LMGKREHIIMIPLMFINGELCRVDSSASEIFVLVSINRPVFDGLAQTWFI
jgi:hypothetical protein